MRSDGRLSKPVLRTRLLTTLLLGLLAAGAAGADVPPPCKETAALPQLQQTGVVVPWEDFKKILEEIRHVEPPVPPEPPPVDFALSACEVSAVVTDDERQARVRMQFSLQVLNGEHWVEVPIIGEGVALARFEIDGRAANVYREDGFHKIALRGAGRHEIVLEYLAAVQDSHGSHTTYLRFPQAPVIALDLRVGRPRLAFEIDGAVVRSTERSNGSTRVLAAFQQARDASITWFKQAEAQEQETKLFGELRTLLSIGEGMLRGTAQVVYTIHGKGVTRFRIGLPDDLTVLDVGGQGIDDWSIEGAAETRVLVVGLNHEAQGSYALQVSFERALGDATAETSVPDLALLDVLRDRGFVAVAAATNVEITPAGELENATPVDPVELPAELTALAGQPVLYGFKYLRHPMRVGLSIVKHEDLAVKRTIVEHARLFTYLSPEGKCITSARYRVKNNRKQYLELTLPEGGEGWGAYVDDQPVKAALADGGKILIPLKKTATTAAGELEPFEVELVYLERDPAGSWGRHVFAGPRLDVDAMEVEWHVFLPRDKRYAGFSGNLHPDDELNEIVYFDTQAYNLRVNEDLERLTRLGDKDRPDAPAATPDEREPALAGGERRDRVEKELKKLEQPPAAPPAGFAQSQVSSNVVLDAGAFAGAAGRVRGVLPVRFGIPVDGLRLSFTGRILTAAETPTIRIDYWPAFWVLSGTAVFFASFFLGLTALLLLGSRRPLSLKLVAALPVAALAATFVVVPGTRGALAAGLALALVGFAAARVFRRTRAEATAALGLVVFVAFASGTRAGESAAPPRPTIPDLPGTEVTLSWEDFKALVEQTYVPVPAPPAPPTDAFLRSAEFRGQLRRGLLTLQGTLSLEVLKEGWVQVPLGSQGTVIRFEGDGALLHRNGSGLEVLARGPRTLTLKVELAFPASETPGENHLAIQLPEAARNLLDLSTAPEFRDVAVETGLAYGARNERLFVSLSGGTFAMKYSLPFPRDEATSAEEVEREPRVQLFSYQLLSLGEGVASGILVHDYTVRVAKVSHFDIDLPDDVVVFDCTAAGLESWKILRRDDQRYLRANLLAPAEGGVRVTVYFERAYDAAEGRVGVPRFPPLSIERESGFVAVAAEGAEVDLQLTGKLLPADVSEIPADVRAMGGNLVGAFKYSGVPDAATVSVTEHEDAPVLTAIIESLNATAAVLDDGTEATWIDLTVKNNRKQFLRFRVPGEEIEVWSLLLDGEPAKPKRTGDDVLVPLPKGDRETAARISLVLLRHGRAPRSFGRLEPCLPTFDVPVSQALWTVYLPAGKRYVAAGGDFRPILTSAPLLPAGGAGFDARSLPAEAVGQVYSEVASDEVAEAQVRQEQAMAQQFKQKSAARKGSLPVRIAIPGGVEQLPRVTVSRMLIVGDEPNTFVIRVYPAWLTAVLRLLQPVLLVASAMLLGLGLARTLDRGRLRLGIVCGILGVVPFGGLHPAFALGMLVSLTSLAWASIRMLRRSRSAAAA